MKLEYLSIMLLALTGCASTNRDVGDNHVAEAKVAKWPDKQYIQIDCKGDNNSMQICIDAANRECPSGWFVTSFYNDDTNTLAALQQRQTKYRGGIVSTSPGYRGRYMYVICKQ
jgi:hypothetical protein